MNKFKKFIFEAEGDTSSERKVKVKRSELESLEKTPPPAPPKGESSSVFSGLIGTVILPYLFGKGVDMIRARQAAAAAQAAIANGATVTQAATTAGQTAGLTAQATANLTVSVERAAAEQAFARLTGQAVTQAASGTTTTGTTTAASGTGRIGTALRQAGQTPLRELATQRGLWLKTFFVRDPGIVAQMTQGNPGVARTIIQQGGRAITPLLTKTAGAVGINATTLGSSVGTVAAGTVALAVAVGAVVGTASGWVINKTISWFGTGYKELVSKTIQKASKDENFLIKELNDYQQLGGYDYESGDEDNKTELDYGLGLSQKGERKTTGILGFGDYVRLGKGVINLRDGIIVLSLLSILYQKDLASGKITKTKEVVDGEEFEFDDVSNSRLMNYTSLIYGFGNVQGGKFNVGAYSELIKGDNQLMSFLKSLLISLEVSNIPASKTVEPKIPVKSVVKVKGQGNKEFVVAKILTKPNEKGENIVIVDDEGKQYTAKEDELEMINESKKRILRKKIINEINNILNEATNYEIINNIRTSELKKMHIFKDDKIAQIDSSIHGIKADYAIQILNCTGFTDNLTFHELSRYVSNPTDATANARICNSAKGIVITDGIAEEKDGVYYVSCINGVPNDLAFMGYWKTFGTFNVEAVYNAWTYQGRPLKNWTGNTTINKNEIIKASDNKEYVFIKYKTDNKTGKIIIIAVGPDGKTYKLVKDDVKSVVK